MAAPAANCPSTPEGSHVKQGNKRINRQWSTPVRGPPATTSTSTPPGRPLASGRRLYTQVAAAAAAGGTSPNPTRSASKQSPNSPIWKELGTPTYQSEYYQTYDRRLTPLRMPDVGAFGLLPQAAVDDPVQLHNILVALLAPAINAVEISLSLRVLEINFMDANTRDRYVTEGIPLGRTTSLRCVVPPPTPPRLVTYHVDRVPYNSSAACTTMLRKIFSIRGIVHEVRPRVWAGTRLNTLTWQVVVAPISGASQPPSTIPILANGADLQRSHTLIVERHGVRNVCQFCLATSHTREDCRHNKAAKTRKSNRGSAPTRPPGKKVTPSPKQQQTVQESSSAPDTSTTHSTPIPTAPVPTQAMEM